VNTSRASKGKAYQAHRMYEYPTYLTPYMMRAIPMIPW